MKSRILTGTASVLFGFCALFGVREASAIAIDVTVVDSTTIQLAFSGTLQGPAPDAQLGIIFIDATVLDTVSSGSVDITGTYSLGGFPIHSAFSGYPNAPYGGSIQLRNSLNGGTPFIVGAVFSGTATIIFGVSHGLAQSMFDGGGAPIYWGRNCEGNCAAGTLQGYTNDSTPVPEPGSLALLGLGLLGLGVSRRRKAT